MCIGTYQISYFCVYLHFYYELFNDKINFQNFYFMHPLGFIKEVTAPSQTNHTAPHPYYYHSLTHLQESLRQGGNYTR